MRHENFISPDFYITRNSQHLTQSLCDRKPFFELLSLLIYCDSCLQVQRKSISYITNSKSLSCGCCGRAISYDEITFEKEVAKLKKALENANLVWGYIQ